MSSLRRLLTAFSVERPSARGNSEIKPPSHIRTASKDGPSALKDLENVRNVICVAFGAFDRYYLSWEDNDGEFHQGESTILPEYPEDLESDLTLSQQRATNCQSA